MSEKRDKIRSLAFTEAELKEIKKYAKYFNMTQSEFIRQAIFDKIRRIENPNDFSAVNNPEVMKQLLANQELIIQEQKLVKEKLKTVNGIKEGYKSLKSLMSEGIVKENLYLKADKLADLMKAHNNKGFTPKELHDLTGFDMKTIDLTLAGNSNRFGINENGRWILND